MTGSERLLPHGEENQRIKAGRFAIIRKSRRGTATSVGPPSALADGAAVIIGPDALIYFEWVD
jgi:hypothetical protein